MAKLQTIPPAVYQRMGLQQARLKSMPRGKFIQWITDFYNDAYKTGWNECMDKYNAASATRSQHGYSTRSQRRCNNV